ncbi:EF-hand domain-containing protein [Sneathiella sp.]|uniref:EF-hand domain-containing protein n=1 Tax=Sneathiella sp. TaxID=1964365 RepID=UPI0025DB5EB6|nr:EF-hand domain-containing protein [Sneathiella sp.]
MKRKIIVGSLIAALTVPVLAVAATDGDGKAQHKGGMFERLDTNNDGELTFEEMTAKSTERFSKLDKDGNGTISVEEMTIRKKEFFDKLDVDGSGSISMEEAKAFRQKKHEDRKERHSARLMELLDADGNGTVSSDEFAAASTKRFEAADSNGDGVLSADELLNLRPKKGGMKKG